GKDQVQYLVFRYVHGCTNMVAMTVAFEQCLKFQNVLDFEVSCQKRAKIEEKPLVLVHATAVNRRSTSSCEACRNNTPCDAAGCETTPMQGVKFTCQLGYHICNVHTIRWTQKQHHTDLNTLSLRSGGSIRSVHLKNTRFKFSFPGDTSI